MEGSLTPSERVQDQPRGAASTPSEQPAATGESDSPRRERGEPGDTRRRADENLAELHVRHEAQLADARREIDELERQLLNERAALERSELSERSLRARVDRQAEQLSYFKKLKTEEVRYRLGDALVRAATNPVDLLLLPGRVAKLLFVGLRRRRERKRTNARPVAIASAAPRISFTPVQLPDRPPRLSVNVAAIMDEFTYECFRPECRLLAITPDDWRQVIDSQPVDLLFVESAWYGNSGAWQYRIARQEPISEGPLKELVHHCRSRGIPTVFWNKEDPPNFAHFIHAATLFDHIFTTDENCIPLYRAHVRHSRVYALPFAAQPAIHNPIGGRREFVGEVCFAGTYYSARHDDRRAELDMLLRPARERGLHIYDRMHDDASGRYRFPREYQESIRGGLPYPEMLDAYKRYRVFLNVNSVADSPTMFSRRVFELLACGTPVISTYSPGIERLLGADCVALVRTPEDVRRWMDRLLDSADVAERMTHLAQRRIFREHTYEQRLRTVLERIGISVAPRKERVSIVTCTNRPGQLEHVIANYQRQTVPEKQLVLVLNHDDFSLAKVRERLKRVPNAHAVQRPESCTLGECLNLAVDESQHEYWTKFDDDNFYAADFASDLLLPFGYTDAALVGKYSYYAYLEGSRRLVLRYPGTEHEYVDFLSGSAMIVDRRVFAEARFPPQNCGEDTTFIRDCVDRGFKLYSADRFNYVVRRSKSVDDHTWKISEEEFMEHCRAVAYTDDYESHVVV